MFCIPKYYHNKKLYNQLEQYKMENIIFQETMKVALYRVYPTYVPNVSESKGKLVIGAKGGR